MIARLFVRAGLAGVALGVVIGLLGAVIGLDDVGLIVAVTVAGGWFGTRMTQV